MRMSAHADERLPGNDTFISKVGSPYQFTVSISCGHDGARSRLMSVTGDAVGSGGTLTREYCLRDTEHRDYISFFSSLAHDFGTRVPRNRSNVPTSHHETSCTALLT